MYSVFRTVMDEGNPDPIMARKALYAGIIERLENFRTADDGSGCQYYITEKGKEIYKEILPLFSEFEE